MCTRCTSKNCKWPQSVQETAAKYHHVQTELIRLWGIIGDGVSKWSHCVSGQIIVKRTRFELKSLSGKEHDMNLMHGVCQLAEIKAWKGIPWCWRCITFFYLAILVDLLEYIVTTLGHLIQTLWLLTGHPLILATPHSYCSRIISWLVSESWVETWLGIQWSRVNYVHTFSIISMEWFGALSMLCLVLHVHWEACSMIIGYTVPLYAVLMIPFRL